MAAAATIPNVFFYREQSHLCSFLVTKNELEWKEELDTIATGILKRLNDGNNNNFRETVEEQFTLFRENAFKACVEEVLLQHFDPTVDWSDFMEKEFRRGFGIIILPYKLNHELLLRGCHKGDSNVVEALFKKGFRLDSRLLKGHENNASGGGQEVTDVIMELNRLESLSTPIYLLMEAKYSRGTMDPVKQAFHLMQRVIELKSSMKSFSNRLRQILDSLHTFTLKMLDLCNAAGNEKTLLFLTQDDELDGVSVGESMLPARTVQALQLGHRNFVNHDSCQQVIRMAFYADGYDGRRKLSFCDKLSYGINQVLGTPIFALCFVLARIKCKCQGGGGGINLKRNLSEGLFEYKPIVMVKVIEFVKASAHNLEVPVNRLVSASTCYAMFLCWVFLTQLNPEDSDNVTDINFYDTFAAIWAFSYICADLQIMYHLSKSIRDDTNICRVNLLMTRTKKFFSNLFYDFRLLAHVLFLTGILVEAIGYCFYEDREERDMECHRDDPSSYHGVHPVKVGIGLQGVSIAMIVLYVLHMFRLDPKIGAVYVAMWSCLGTIISFAITYLLLTLGFGLGLYFTLKYNNEKCGEDKEMGTIEANVTCISRANKTETNPCLKYVNFGDLDFEKNRFTCFQETCKTLFWSLFDPGHPGVVGCSEGFTRYAGLFLWALYNTIIVIVLLNLLIALMNTTMSAIQENKIDSWKYHRTHFWMEFCSKDVILPAPLNLANLILDFITCSACRGSNMSVRTIDATDGNNSNIAQYTELVLNLSLKYLSDLEDFWGECSDRKEQLDKLRADMTMLITDANENLLQHVRELSDKLNLLLSRAQ